VGEWAECERIGLSELSVVMMMSTYDPNDKANGMMTTEEDDTTN
jgi:hypothetical protein